MQEAAAEFLRLFWRAKQCEGVPSRETQLGTLTNLKQAVGLDVTIDRRRGAIWCAH